MTSQPKAPPVIITVLCSVDIDCLVLGRSEVDGDGSIDGFLELGLHPHDP